MSSRPHFRNGKQLPAGEGVGPPVTDREANGSARKPRGSGDRPVDRPPRPCSRCGKEFKPTLKRRMLCGSCFSYANDMDNPLEPDTECAAGDLIRFRYW